MQHHNTININRTDGLPLYRQLMQAMVSDLALKSPGDAMPSIRELIRRTGLSHQTVVRTMEELERQGYINLVAGKGAFVAHRERALRASHPSRCPNGTIVMAYPDGESHWLNNLVRLAEIQAVRGGHGLLTYRLGPVSTWQDLVDFLRDEKKLAGVLLCPPADLFKESDLTLLDSLEIPMVSFHPFSREWKNLRAVSGDPVNTGRVMARALLDLGHREIAFLRHEPTEQIQNRYEEGMRQALSEKGLDPKSLTLWGEVINGFTNGQEAAYRITQEQIARGLGNVTGICYTTSIGALAGSRAFFDAGLSIPDDLSVIGSTDHPLLKYAHPSISATGGDWEEAMPIAFSFLRGENPARSFTVLSQCFVRESLGPPRP